MPSLSPKALKCQSPPMTLAQGEGPVATPLRGVTP